MSTFFALDLMECEALSYTQFVAACISADPDHLSDSKLSVAFRNMDVDGDSAISL